jgi:hypothetical protein
MEVVGCWRNGRNMCGARESLILSDRKKKMKERKEAEEEERRR